MTSNSWLDNISLLKFTFFSSNTFISFLIKQSHFSIFHFYAWDHSFWWHISIHSSLKLSTWTGMLLNPSWWLPFPFVSLWSIETKICNNCLLESFKACFFLSFLRCNLYFNCAHFKALIIELVILIVSSFNWWKRLWTFTKRSVITMPGFSFYFLDLLPDSRYSGMVQGQQ